METDALDTDAVETVAAVDVGGTRVKAALVDREGRELVSVTTPTPREGAGRVPVVDVVATVVTRLAAEAADRGVPVRTVGCGVVVPGVIDDTRGTAVFSANLGWRDLDVVGPLVARLGLPVALGHDVRAGLVAETRWGAAHGAANTLFVPVGTGIAGALMVDGHVLVGGGYAGELGHVVVEPGGPRCGCGARGCLEAISSAAAVERAYAERRGLAALVPADQVAALVLEGDPDAAVVWRRAVEALARGVVAAVTLTGVDLVLVGGGLAQSGEVLLGPLREGVRSSLTFQRVPRIARAALGDRAGCLGAACLAWDVL